MPIVTTSQAPAAPGVVQAPQRTPGVVINAQGASSSSTESSDGIQRLPSGKYRFRGKDYNAELDPDGKLLRLYADEVQFTRVKRDGESEFEAYTPEELLFSEGQLSREIYRDTYRVLKNDKKTVRDVYERKIITYRGDKITTEKYDTSYADGRGNVFKVSKESEDYAGNLLFSRDYKAQPVQSGAQPRYGSGVIVRDKTGRVTYASPDVVRVLGGKSPVGEKLPDSYAQEFTALAAGKTTVEKIEAGRAARSAAARQQAAFEKNLIDKVAAGDTLRGADLIPEPGLANTPQNVAAVRQNVMAANLNRIDAIYKKAGGYPSLNGRNKANYLDFPSSFGDRFGSIVFNSRTSRFSGLDSGGDSDAIILGRGAFAQAESGSAYSGRLYGFDFDRSINSSARLGFSGSFSGLLGADTSQNSISKEADRIARSAQGLNERAERTKDFFRIIPGLRGDNYLQRGVRYGLAAPTLATIGFVDTLRVGISAGKNVFAGIQNPSTKEITLGNLASFGREAPAGLIKSLDVRDPEGLVNLGLLVLPATPKVAKIARVESVALDVRAPSVRLIDGVEVPTTITNVRAKTFGLDLGTKSLPVFTKVETTSLLKSGVSVIDEARYLGKPPKIGTQAALVEPVFQPESALAGSILNQLIDTGATGATRLRSTVTTARILQGEKGLPVKEFVTKVPGIKNPKSASALVEDFLGKKGIIYGSSTTEQLPVGYRTLKPGDIDAIIPDQTALRIAPRVKDLARRLRASGEAVRVSRRNPLIIEFTKNRDKFIEVKSGLEPGAFGEEVAPAGFLGIRFADLRAGQEPKTVPFGRTRAIYAGEQQARKAAAASAISPPLKVSDAPRAFKDGGVVGKDRPVDSRIVKDIAGFIQSTEGLLVIRQSTKLKNLNPVRALRTAKARAALADYIGTFDDAQKTAINAYLVEKTGRELIPLAKSTDIERALRPRRSGSSASAAASARARSPLTSPFNSAASVGRSPSPGKSARSAASSPQSPRSLIPRSPAGGSPSPRVIPRSKSPSSPLARSASLPTSLRALPSPYATSSPVPLLPSVPNRPLVPRIERKRPGAFRRRKKGNLLDLVEGFDVEVRRQGRFQKINSKPLDLARAFAAGDKRVRTTAAATFRIRKSGVALRRTGAPRINPATYYRKITKGQTLFIQRRNKRIGTKGELRDITYKGVAARRKNGLF